jgi:hypothetical protein
MINKIKLSSGKYTKMVFNKQEVKPAESADNKGVKDDKSNDYKNSLRDNKGSIKDYLRIGTKYYRETYRPDKNGRKVKEFTPWDRTTIIEDFSKTEFSDVRKYKGFCHIPSHVNYREEIDGFFNEYSELSHVPKGGDFHNIINLITHIFGNEYVDFALDYIQLLYLKPTQRLPIILLESAQRNTGKSTFGILLNAIFEQNSIKLGNNDLEGSFNGYWTKKLLMIVDEASISENGAIQMIKRFSTESGTVVSNEKNKAQTQTEFIGKFVLMSNEEGRAYPIEKGENRFAVFKVPTFAENGITDDPDIEAKLKAEIPAFLDFLQKRQTAYKGTGRMYFPESAYFTPQLQVYYKNSLSYNAKAIKLFIVDAFDMFNDQEVLMYSVADLMYELKNGGYVKYSIDKQSINKALGDLGFIEPQKRSRHVYYSLYRSDSVTGYHTTNKNLVHYVFSRDWLKLE